MNHVRSFPLMMDVIRGTVITCEEHLRYLMLAVNLVRSVPGEAAEIGVYRGGTARLIAEILKDRPLHLFETFTGIPDNTDPSCGHPKGAMTANEQEVRRFLSTCPNVLFHVGIFPQTAQGLEGCRFSFVHFDGDTYPACKAAIQFFWPRMNPGGVISFHDYGDVNCPGVKRAVEEAGLDIVCVCQCQGFVVKTN